MTGRQTLRKLHLGCGESLKTSLVLPAKPVREVRKAVARTKAPKKLNPVND